MSSVSSQTAGGAASSVSYSYDASGSTTVRPGQSITYDATGKPVSNTNTATGQAQISVFDASGNLLVVNDPTAGITAYLGDTQLHVAVGSQTVTATRTYTAGSVPVAERTTSAGVAGSTLNWLCVDAQNTASVEVNATTGAVTRRYQDPFGANRAGTITPAWSSTNTYLNAPSLAATGLVQLGARQYDPSIGKFLTVNPVFSPSDPQQDNGYSYSHNSPITGSDPSGLSPCNDDGQDSGCGDNSYLYSDLCSEDCQIAHEGATPPAPGQDTGTGSSNHGRSGCSGPDDRGSCGDTSKLTLGTPLRLRSRSRSRG